MLRRIDLRIFLTRDNRICLLSWGSNFLVKSLLLDTLKETLLSLAKK